MDIGHVKDCLRRNGSDEYISNLSCSFNRYGVCTEQEVSSQEQGSSLEVVGDCSTLNVSGGVSSLGKSSVRLREG